MKIKVSKARKARLRRRMLFILVLIVICCLLGVCAFNAANGSQTYPSSSATGLQTKPNSSAAKPQTNLNSGAAGSGNNAAEKPKLEEKESFPWESIWTEFLCSGLIANDTHEETRGMYEESRATLLDINNDRIPELLVSFPMENAYGDLYLLLYRIEADMSVTLVSSLDTGVGQSFPSHQRAKEVTKAEYCRTIEGWLEGEEVADPFCPAHFNIPLMSELMPYINKHNGTVVYVDAIHNDGRNHYMQGLAIYGADRQGKAGLIDSCMSILNSTEEAIGSNRIYSEYWQQLLPIDDMQFELWIGASSRGQQSPYHLWYNGDNVDVEQYVRKMMEFKETYVRADWTIDWIEINSFSQVSQNTAEKLISNYEKQRGTSTSASEDTSKREESTVTASASVPIFQDKNNFELTGYHPNPNFSILLERYCSSVFFGPEGISKVTHDDVSDDLRLTKGILSVHMAEFTDGCYAGIVVTARDTGKSKDMLDIYMHLVYGEADYFVDSTAKHGIRLFGLQAGSFQFIEFAYLEADGQDILIAHQYSDQGESQERFIAYSMYETGIVQFAPIELLSLTCHRSNGEIYVNCDAAPTSILDVCFSMGDARLEKDGALLYYEADGNRRQSAQNRSYYSSAEDAIAAAFAQIGVHFVSGDPLNDIPCQYSSRIDHDPEILLRVHGNFC